MTTGRINQIAILLFEGRGTRAWAPKRILAHAGRGSVAESPLLETQSKQRSLRLIQEATTDPPEHRPSVTKGRADAVAVAFVLLAFHQRWPPQSTSKGTRLSLARGAELKGFAEATLRSRVHRRLHTTSRSALGVDFLCDMDWGLMLCIA